MNTKSLYFVIFVFSFLLLSCEKNETDTDFVIHDYRIHDILYAKGSKLKRFYDVYSDNSRILRAEYMYDDLGRISRKNYGSDIFAYDIYQYDMKGELEKISTYAVHFENPPVLTHTVIYSYDTKGNKVKEQTEFTDNRETVYNLFQYTGEELAKQEHYEGDQQTYYIVYEYKGSKPVKERFYVPEEKDFVTTDHIYDQDLLVYSVTYSENPKSGFMYDKRNYYDRNDNLVKIVSNHPGLSSMSGATSFLITSENEYE